MAQSPGKKALQNNDHLSKPIFADKLVTKLHGWSQVVLAHPQENFAEAQAIALIVPLPTALPPLLIDWNHLHQIADHNPEFELELLQMFAEDTEHHLCQLEAAIAAQDFSALEQHAHHIKGSSANVGLRPMQTAASNLEIQARSHQLDHSAQEIFILQQTLKSLQTFLAVEQV
ncbi:MAG: Hpt domain-containing protein [Leptolyngbyaceae cyanobacterium CAN_BIN12]|nr:Hpt domain-containing protein [Leptolyngbyaceae cyanobacterium CAN_BIN12]